MRQVFTSTRLENVEGVAKMLGEHGIETKITQGRSWKGNSRREFSYSAKHHDEAQQPAVWVLKSEDFKEARELLHEGGLLASTRETSYLPENLQFRDAPPGGSARRVSRIRIALLIGVLCAFAFMVGRVVGG